MVFGTLDDTPLMAQRNAVERRYDLPAVKQRLHQASFWQTVILAYGGKCAISGIPEPLLLDAAHIIEDRNEQLGQPVFTNGPPLSKLHHAALDARLIGIDPDYRLHVSSRLLIQHDDPMMDALQRLDGAMLHRLGRQTDWSDRERLAIRFAHFKAAA